MSTRPVVSAEPREILGKKVSTLRRQGILPAVVHGHGKGSQPIQLDAREFDELRRTTARNTLVDLRIGGHRAIPVLLQGIHEHPVRRYPMHVDFYVVKMTQELTVDVPINFVGESHAAEKLGGTLLHLREAISVRALPGELPSGIDLDITPLASFDDVLHVRDLVVPDGVTVLVDGDEPLARVQPPRVEEEALMPAEAGVAPEGEAAPIAEAAQAEAGGAAETAPAEEDAG